MKNLSELKTPCLILDADKVRRNASRMLEIAERNSVRLRPHIKSHKCVEIARIQTAGQNGAVTTSTLREIWSFADHGFSDFTYAVPVEPGKFGEVVEIAKSGIRISVITDNREIYRELDDFASRAKTRISVFLKVDCGYHRCGVDPDSNSAFSIASELSESRNLAFAGVLTHAGHSYHARTVKEIATIASSERDIMVGFASALRNRGIRVPTVSIGSTPTISHIDHLKGIDEIRPGNYVLFDAFQATLGSCSFDDCALSVLTAVVSRNRESRQIVVDAGAIALSKDRGPIEKDPNCGYGKVLDLDGNETGINIESVSQEHGILRANSDEQWDRFRIGARFRILANHSCLTSAQHSGFNVLENGTITEQWAINGGW